MGWPWGRHPSLLAEVKEFVLVPLHSAPHDAVAEIDALYDVYLAIINKWGTDVSVTITGGAPRLGTEPRGLFDPHWDPAPKRAQPVQEWWDGNPVPTP